MPKTKLSKRTIDALKPRAERFTVWDTSISGFGIRITPNDQRVYVLKYRFGGTQHWFTIGKHGSPWTPDAARDKAKELLGDITKGINPAARRDADKQALTVSALCDLYLAEGFCATFNREKRPHPNRRKVAGYRAALRAAVRAWPRSASR
jgi:Arm DNA-binding domain